MSKSKSKYKVKNWSEYDASLKQLGSLTFCLSPDVIKQWLSQKETGQKGVPDTYSNVAIELIAKLKSLFSLAGGQTEGFLESIFSHYGNKANISRPHDFVSVSRKNEH
ncbi:MAG: transposase [Trichodesmium sp. St16_bin4-tuft]|nr:transposase [Trichodesmium sp. St4_bin8_1]MDE5074458.1 transposase [Trichodesmium sp. St5_bin8]MDE5079365.1 transposase [Trichodesmium sp. St2_bin6]MDE5092144.1 transposase [Trichodesmium sp. St18_bin3_1_1]MDE5100234.1 transposase [Trichodesmium sp. St16_bin4-tuft]MDE5105442.1 transposase [Trichodesmium sp. St19_bin2]